MIERFLPGEMLGAMNGAVFLLHTLLFGFLVVFIFNQLQRHGWVYRRAYYAIAVSIPMAVWVAGDGLIRFLIWFSRVAALHHWAFLDDYKSLLLTGFLVGVILIYGGTICMMRVMFDGRFPNWVWVAIAVLCTVFGLVTVTIGV